MAQSRTVHAAEFDSVVIGGGLEGLLAAHQLESTGRRVALVESFDSLGGNCRPSTTPIGVIDHGLKFFPDTPETSEALDWLESVLGEKISRETIDAPPLTYDDGKFKPFVGFGEQKIISAHEIDAYAKSRFLRLSTTPKDWIPRLIDSFAGTLLTQSVATKLQVDDGFIIEILVNGSKRLCGREIFFCATPQQLPKLLSESHAPGKLRQKLAKGDFWTSVNLDLIHRGQVTDHAAVHVLRGANEEPSVGLFHPVCTLPDGQTAQLSQWLTLVPRDITDDSELVAAALKHIKRQIKRAYEASLDGVIKERIVVNPTSHGDLQGVLREDGQWPKLQNLWLISPFTDSAKNTVGAIRQARRTLAGLIGEPVQAFASDTDLHEGPHPTV